MYSLVLIDDELWALNDLKDLIDWESLGFTDIRCFDDPSAALASILKDPPDAVFTDVRMPDLSGLDLMDRCRKQGLDTLFVIVSAYADFSYAKRAIESNAFSYILKPISPDELRSVAEKLRAQIQSGRSFLLYKAVRTLTLQALTGSKNRTDEALSRLEGHIGLDYRIVVSGYALEGSPGIWTSVYDDLSVGVCSKGELPLEGARYGISTVSSQMQEMPERIREALIAYYTMLFYGLDEPLTYHPDQIDLKSIQLLSESLSERLYPHAKAQLDAILSGARERRIMLDSITIFYNGLILQILSSESELMQDIRPFADCFRLFGVLRNAEMLKSSLTAMIDNLMPAETDSQESTADTIKRIVRFVDENYHQDITLEQLAQKHYISVSYLSRKFKETMDVNFSDYLSRKRIEKASRLLESTDLSVSEIGAACGYPNCFYFSRTFKKITGVSPSAYRDKEDTDEE